MTKILPLKDVISWSSTSREKILDRHIESNEKEIAAEEAMNADDVEEEGEIQI